MFDLGTRFSERTIPDNTEAVNHRCLIGSCDFSVNRLGFGIALGDRFDEVLVGFTQFIDGHCKSPSVNRVHANVGKLDAINFSDARKSARRVYPRPVFRRAIDRFDSDDLILGNPDNGSVSQHDPPIVASILDDDNFNGIVLNVVQQPSSEPKLAKRDLFHIPFKLRHKVASQRFSIPGIPCLYTAGSTYTCWEEIGRPPFYELHVAALWVPQGESFRFLDLRWTARAVKSRLAHAAKGKKLLIPDEKLEWARGALASCIPIWPLIALCSVCNGSAGRLVSVCLVKRFEVVFSGAGHPIQCGRLPAGEDPASCRKVLRITVHSET